MDIDGRSYIVTGASSDIGVARARHLYGLGANVTLAPDAAIEAVPATGAGVVAGVPT